MGHTEVVYELAMDLVTKSRNPNPPNTIDSNTPLHYAAIKGHIEIIKFFIPLTNGNHNVANNQGFTPKNLAIRKGHEYLAYLLAPIGTWRFNPRLIYLIYSILFFISFSISFFQLDCYPNLFLFTIGQWIGYSVAHPFSLSLHFLAIYFAYRDKLRLFSIFNFCSHICIVVGSGIFIFGK